MNQRINRAMKVSEFKLLEKCGHIRSLSEHQRDQQAIFGAPSSLLALAERWFRVRSFQFTNAPRWDTYIFFNPFSEIDRGIESWMHQTRLRAPGLITWIK